MLHAATLCVPLGASFFWEFCLSCLTFPHEHKLLKVKDSALIHLCSRNTCWIARSEKGEGKTPYTTSRASQLGFCLLHCWGAHMGRKSPITTTPRASLLWDLCPGLREGFGCKGLLRCSVLQTQSSQQKKQKGMVGEEGEGQGSEQIPPLAGDPSWDLICFLLPKVSVEVTSVYRGQALTSSVSEARPDPISGHRMDWTLVPQKLSALGLHFHYRAPLQNMTLSISLHVRMSHKVCMNKYIDYLP